MKTDNRIIALAVSLLNQNITDTNFNVFLKVANSFRANGWKQRINRTDNMKNSFNSFFRFFAVDFLAYMLYILCRRKVLLLFNLSFFL